MKMIPEWRQAWKYFSMQAMTVGFALSAQYTLMFDQMRDIIPPNVMTGITGIVFVIGMIGRLRTQDVK